MNNYTDQIEDYISGQLVGDKLHTFEKELSSNSALQEEVNFQQVIIKGIQQARKQQLKTMLSSINPQPWYFQTATKWSAGLFVGSALVVSYLYFAYFPQSKFINPKEISVREKEHSTKIVWKEFNKPEKQMQTFEVSKHQPELTFPEKVTTRIFKKPTVDIPNPIFNQNEEVLITNSENRDFDFRPTTNQSNEIRIAIEESSNKGVRMYSYSEGELKLFGDFSEEKYRVFEINGSKDRNVYLYYLNEYYQLTPVSEPTLLEPIVDKEILRNLELVSASLSQ